MQSRKPYQNRDLSDATRVEPSRFGSLPIAFVCIIIAWCSLPVSLAQAQALVYPARNQSPQQTERDKAECAAWSKQQTGFDPTAAAAPVPGAPPPSPQGGVVRGAAGGAALGAVGGAIGGDAGKGAAIGAATGALFGGFRQRDRRMQQEQA
jgi:Glycine zipper